jgi:prophage regulatory protein
MDTMAYRRRFQHARGRNSQVSNGQRGAIDPREMQDHAMTTDASDRILRLNAVLDRTGLSRSTLYRKMQNGTFPKNVQISERCAGWRESAINAWSRNPMFYQATDDPDL